MPGRHPLPRHDLQHLYFGVVAGDPMSSVLRGPRRDDHAICAAVAPDSVPHHPDMRRRPLYGHLSAQIQPSREENQQVSDPQTSTSKIVAQLRFPPGQRRPPSPRCRSRGRCKPEIRPRSGDGPRSVRRRPSAVNGASRFLRKWPPATLDRGASTPPPASIMGQAEPARTGRGPSPARGRRSPGNFHDLEYTRNDVGRQKHEPSSPGRQIAQFARSQRRPPEP
jgi:hypothetical protein